MEQQESATVSVAQAATSQAPPSSEIARTLRPNLQLSTKAFWRSAVAILLIALVAAYIWRIVRYGLQPDRRLGATELALLVFVAIAVYAIVNPNELKNWLAAISKVSGWGVAVELRERVKKQEKKVRRQQGEVLAINAMLTALITEENRDHLKRLASGRYIHERDNELRDQLRNQRR